MSDQFCFWLQEPDGRFKCGVCGFARAWAGEGKPPPKNCGRVEDPTNGPGRELTSLLKSFGLEENHACGCQAKARAMNIWGPEGCRLHFDTIVGWMKEAYALTSWSDRAKAAAAALANGLAIKINPLAPFDALVMIAIERSEAKLKQEAKT